MSIMLGTTSVQELHGPWTDFMDKLQGENGDEWFTAFKKFLRKENPWPLHKWREKDGVIYFSVTSDGTTGEDWITRLESKGFRVDDNAKMILRSSDFKPTSGVTTEVAVLKGVLFEDSDRITRKICREADCRKLSKPNAEVACLIREKFTDEEIEAMVLVWIIAMHEPINDSDGNPYLLDANYYEDGRQLGRCNGRPDCKWKIHNGFAFAVLQVSSQS